MGAGKMGSFFIDLLSFDHEVAVFERDPKRMRFTYNCQRFTSLEEVRELTISGLLACIHLGRNDYIGHLVLITCLGKPSLVEVTVLMLHLFYYTVNREPIGMNIEETHEDAHHDALLLEILILKDLLNHYHLTVSRSHDKVIRLICTEQTYRATEEVQHNTPYCTEDDNKDSKWYVTVERPP